MSQVRDGERVGIGIVGRACALQTVVGLANVRFGILPMTTELVTTPQNSFQIYDELVVVETFIGETIHRGDEADAYARIMDRLGGKPLLETTHESRSSGQLMHLATPPCRDDLPSMGQATS